MESVIIAEVETQNKFLYDLDLHTLQSMAAKLRINISNFDLYSKINSNATEKIFLIERIKTFVKTILKDIITDFEDKTVDEIKQHLRPKTKLKHFEKYELLLSIIQSESNVKRWIEVIDFYPDLSNNLE